MNGGPFSQQVPSRVWLAAHAPSSEIESIIGDTAKSVCEFLGKDAKDYNWRVDYLAALSKARYVWADAMLSARNLSPLADDDGDRTVQAKQ
jgi:hypothetical protein